MTRGRRPEHPFPGLARGVPSQSSSRSTHSAQPRQVPPRPSFLPPEFTDTFHGQTLSRASHEALSLPPIRTPAYRRFSNLIRQGARVLLDLQSGECVLYTCANGLKMLARLTVRTLAQLLRQGDLVMAARENHWIHYAHPGANLAWFQPEH